MVVRFEAVESEAATRCMTRRRKAQCTRTVSRGYLSQRRVVRQPDTSCYGLHKRWVTYLRPRRLARLPSHNLEQSRVYGPLELLPQEPCVTMQTPASISLRTVHRGRVLVWRVSTVTKTRNLEWSTTSTVEVRLAMMVLNHSCWMIGSVTLVDEQRRSYGRELV